MFLLEYILSRKKIILYVMIMLVFRTWVMQISTVICGWWHMWWEWAACYIPIRPKNHQVRLVIQFHHTTCSNGLMGVQFSILTMYSLTKIHLLEGLPTMRESSPSRCTKERRKTSISSMNWLSKNKVINTIYSQGNRTMVSVLHVMNKWHFYC